jgi:hypothetical protein
MVYIKRGKNNEVVAVHLADNDQGLEPAANDSEEVADFLFQCALGDHYAFLKSDLELIRVIEDLVHVLMQKDILRITDFPAPVIEKLVQRRSIRQEFDGVSNILEDD